jgi:hypothetical protein
MALTRTTPARAADDPYAPVPAENGVCLDENRAYDGVRDRCVSKIGWCRDRLWTCEGKPERHHHPHFRCDPERKRQERCCRSWWPPAEGVTPEGARGKGRCWKYKPHPYVATTVGGGS